jgi:predicted dehydrogenase
MIRAIQTSGMSKLAAIASRRPGEAETWAAEFGIPAAHSSYAALIDDPQVAAVYIPLPNELHHPWVLRAAERRKHVLCEKPLALNTAQAEEMAAACRAHGVVLMEAFMWRHHPRVIAAHRMAFARELGDLRLVKMDFSFDIDRSDWRLDAARGGGALFDLGCYGINAARHFFQSEPVAAVARAHFGTRAVDMTFSAHVEFPGDRFALLDASFECPFRCRLEIVGTRRAVELPSGVLPPRESTLVIREGESTREMSFPAADQYTEQVRAFAASVVQGRLVPPAEDGLANMRAVMRLSAAAGLFQR